MRDIEFRPGGSEHVKITPPGAVFRFVSLSAAREPLDPASFVRVHARTLVTSSTSHLELLDVAVELVPLRLDPVSLVVYPR